MKKGRFIFPENNRRSSIFANMITSAVSLFVNGFGIYLTIRANLGSAPWDTLNLGLSKTLGILYGTASISVSFIILSIDILMRESIGLSMFIDAIVVGKSVDFFNFVDVIPKPKNIPDSILMLIVGLFIIGYTQYFYMRSALGCGPRDTLIVGLTKRVKKVPIGAVTMAVHVVVTLTGYFLGGPVGIGTLMCALLSGPIMNLAFVTVGFNATGLHHQNLADSLKILLHRQ